MAKSDRIPLEAVLRFLAQEQTGAKPKSFSATLDSLRIEDYASGDVIPFEPWPHLKYVASLLDRRQSLIILKARQLGISWLSAAYALYRAQYELANVLVISAREADAWDFVQKVRTLYVQSRIPKVPIVRDTRAELWFAGAGRIIALPSTEHAGRGQTATLVIMDEAAFHPYAAQNYQALRPALGTHGQLVVISTANGPVGWFYDMWTKAQSGMSNLVPVFIPWWARPDRQTLDGAPNYDWLEQVRRDQPLQTELEFKAEYPASPDEAFATSSSLVYGIDVDGIPIFDHVRNVKDEPWSWEEAPVRVAGIDPGGGDPTAIVGVSLSPDHRAMHVHWEWTKKGLAGVAEILGVLAAHGKKDWPYDGYRAIIVDRTQQSLIASLREAGMPALPSELGRREGFQIMQFLLKQGLLTHSPDLRDTLREYGTYRWKERRDADGRSYATSTPADHHADHLDALRYAAVYLFHSYMRGGAPFGREEQAWSGVTSAPVIL